MARTPRDNNVVRHPSSPESSFADPSFAQNVRTHDAKPSVNQGGSRQMAQRPPKPLTSAQAASEANREKQMAVNAMRADQIHVANSYAAHAEDLRAQDALARGEGYRPDEPQPYRGPKPTPQPFVSSRPLPPVETTPVETAPVETAQVETAQVETPAEPPAAATQADAGPDAPVRADATDENSSSKQLQSGSPPHRSGAKPPNQTGQIQTGQIQTGEMTPAGEAPAPPAKPAFMPSGGGPRMSDRKPKIDDIVTSPAPADEPPKT